MNEKSREITWKSSTDYNCSRILLDHLWQYSMWNHQTFQRYNCCLNTPKLLKKYSILKFNQNWNIKILYQWILLWENFSRRTISTDIVSVHILGIFESFVKIYIWLFSLQRLEIFDEFSPSPLWHWKLENIWDCWLKVSLVPAWCYQGSLTLFG